MRETASRRAKSDEIMGSPPASTRVEVACVGNRSSETMPLSWAFCYHNQSVWPLEHDVTLVAPLHRIQSCLFVSSLPKNRPNLVYSISSEVGATSKALCHAQPQCNPWHGNLLQAFTRLLACFWMLWSKYVYYSTIRSLQTNTWIVFQDKLQFLK
jgi:hypothetical protein